MKKVLIIAASLFGAALFTTSCVETQESETVTAMREAKLAELQALADQARYQAQLDSIEAAIANATSAAELEKLQLEHQKAMLDLQQQIENLQRQIENDKNQNIINLFNDYKDEVSELNNLKSELNEQNTNLAKYENQLVTAEEAMATQAATIQKTIDRLNAQLQAYQAYDGLSYAELEAEVNKLYTEWNIAKSEEQVAYQTQVNANQSKNDLIAPYDRNDLTIDSHRMLIAMDSLVDLSLNTDDIFGTGVIAHIKYMNRETVTFKDERLKTNVGYNHTVTVYIEALYPEDIIQTRLDIKESIGEPATAGTMPTPATGLYANVDNAESALETAQADLKAAQAGTDEQAIANAQEAVIIAERNLETAEKALAEAQAAQVTFERLAAEVDIDGEAYQAYVNEINALGSNEVIVAYFDACVAYSEAGDKTTDIYAQYNTANTMLRNVDDIESEILNIEQQIANYQQRLAAVEAFYYEYYEAVDSDGDGDYDYYYYKTSPLDLLIQQTNDEIARLNEAIAIQQQIVDAAKAALDAALAAE